MDSSYFMPPSPAKEEGGGGGGVAAPRATEWQEEEGKGRVSKEIENIQI